MVPGRSRTSWTVYWHIQSYGLLRITGAKQWSRSLACIRLPVSEYNLFTGTIGRVIRTNDGPENPYIPQFLNIRSGPEYCESPSQRFDQWLRNGPERGNTSRRTERKTGNMHAARSFQRTQSSPKQKNAIGQTNLSRAVLLEYSQC